MDLIEGFQIFFCEELVSGQNQLGGVAKSGHAIFKGDALL
jgi:hypothetical protein